MGEKRRVLTYGVSLFAAVSLFLTGASAARADLYQWTDKEGVIHLTNDPNRVPESSRERVKVFRSTAAPSEEQAPQALPPASVRPGVASSPAEELYGDQTLSWWVENFRLKRQALQDLESSYAAKKQYAGVFEGGRRMGQIFGAAEVDTYEKYKKQIPEDEKKLETLKDDIEEFRRKAEINGVPKEIRGE